LAGDELLFVLVPNQPLAGHALALLLSIGARSRNVRYVFSNYRSACIDARQRIGGGRNHGGGRSAMAGGIDELSRGGWTDIRV
jgi:hypothetical protein